MRGYTVQPFGVNRRLVAASVAECARHHTIHTITEVDVTEPRRLMREHRERTGEGLSLTAYVVACVGRAIAESPLLNSRRAGRKLIVFDGVTVGTLVEREIDGERVPDMLGIQAAETKSFRARRPSRVAASRVCVKTLPELQGMPSKTPQAGLENPISQ